MLTPIEEAEKFLRVEKEKLSELEKYQADLTQGIANIKNTIADVEKRIEKLRGGNKDG